MANEQNTQGTSARQAREEEISTTGANIQNQKSSDSSVTESAKETAKGLYDQAKGTAGQAYGTAAEKAKATLEEQKSSLSGGLSTVADNIRQFDKNLREADKDNKVTELTANYGDTLAQQIEQVAQYFDRKDLREMVRDVESFARRNPAIFIGAAFGLGLLAARFLKSSSEYQAPSRSRQNEQSLNAPVQNTNTETGEAGSLGTGAENKDKTADTAPKSL